MPENLLTAKSGAHGKHSISGSDNGSYGNIKIYKEIIIILIEEKRNNQLPTTIMKRNQPKYLYQINKLRTTFVKDN